MEKVLLSAVLCFPVRAGEVLLAEKTRHIGAGHYNGYGGGIEKNESLEDAVVRELFQESRMLALRKTLKKVAVVDFHNTKADGDSFTCRVHTFLLSGWVGPPLTTEEMRNPKWFEVQKLPVDKMMPADPFWLPRALAGERIYAEAWYGPRQQTLLQPVEISPLPNVL